MSMDISHTAQMLEFMELCGIGFNLDGKPCVDFGWQDIAAEVKGHHSAMTEALAALRELVNADNGRTTAVTMSDTASWRCDMRDGLRRARGVLAKHGEGK